MVRTSVRWRTRWSLLPATGENVLPAVPTRDYGYAVLGFSSEGRASEAFSFGQGANDIVLIGGMHGATS